MTIKHSCDNFFLKPLHASSTPVFSLGRVLVTFVAPVPPTALHLPYRRWSACLCRKDSTWFPSFLPTVAKLAEKWGLRSQTLWPLLQHRLLALDSLPKPCSPALAGAQIPSTLHSLGLGKESGFLRFLTTLLPEHKDKELFISALLLNTAFLSQSWSPPLLARVSGAGDIAVTTLIHKRAYPLSPPTPVPTAEPCSTVTLPVSPSTTCKPSPLPLPALLEFQTLLFPNTAGMEAPVSTEGWQNPTPVVTLADASLHAHHCQPHHSYFGRHLCSRLRCWAHYKRNPSADLTVYPFKCSSSGSKNSHWGEMTETFTHSPTEIWFLPHKSPKTSLLNLEFILFFTTSISYLMPWLPTSAGLCPNRP